MKKLLSLLLFIPIILNAYINDLQYDKNIAKGSYILGSLLYHNNKLYTTQMGSIGEYNIDENGDLELNKRVFNNNDIFPFIVGDSLYISNIQMELLFGSETGYFKTFNISGNNIEYSDSLISDGIIFPYLGNSDYLFLYYGSEMLSKVYNRQNFEFLTSVQTGRHFSIKDTLLFIEMVQGNQSALSIKSQL